MTTAAPQPQTAPPGRAWDGLAESDLVESALTVGELAGLHLESLDIGIGDAERSEIVAGLSRLLADSYTLYLKTHNFHWNVVGPMFNTLHLMFEDQYTELAGAVDEIAERIRALGAPAPGSFRAFAELTSIEEPAEGIAALSMVAQLVADHQTVVRTARSTMEVVARAGDEPTADLLTQRMQVHEKTAWMLRSMLA